jgi:hypothetical protein
MRPEIERPPSAVIGDTQRQEASVVRVSPQTVRAIEAGDDGLEFLAVGSDRPEGGDGIQDPTAWID